MRGPAVSALVVLLVTARLAAAQPANDDCANAKVITSFPFVDTVDMTTATAEAGEPTDCNGGGHGVWYRIPAETAETLFWMSTAGSTAPVFRVTQFTGTCGALTTVSCEISEDPYEHEVGIAPLGLDFLVRVDAVDGSGTLALGMKRLPEFLVSYQDDAGLPSVAGGPNGFLVAFPSGEGVGARAFDTNGVPLGPAFTVSNDPDRYNVDVAAAGTGRFIVSWDVFPGIHAAVVDGPGSVISVPVDASAFNAYPRAAADADGNFVVVWEGVFARRFDADGGPQGAAFQVGTGFEAAVAMAPGGEFVVVWTDFAGGDGSGWGVKARLFDATGTPLDSEFVANAYTTLDQFFPGVGMDAAGNFVISWMGGEKLGQDDEIPLVARRFTAAGVPLGGDFIVSTDTDDLVQRMPEIAVAPAGEFVVTWEANRQGDFSVHPNGAISTVARRFASDGTPDGAQFFVNSLVREYQYEPDVGVTSDGKFMVVWDDFRNFFDFHYGNGDEDGAVARVLPDVSSPCAPVPLSDCRQSTVPAKSKLALVDDPDPLHDVIRWTWAKGEATDVSAFGDPLATDGYLLCLYDGSDTLIFDATAPAGGTCGEKPCWKGTGTPPGATGFTYKDKQRTPEGLQKLVLKAGIDGKAKVVVKGGGPNLSAGALGMPPLPLVFPARLQLQGPGGECWEAVFSPSGVTTNVPGEFAGNAG